VETGDEEVPPSVEARLPGGGSTEGRYELLESVSFAFLLALEALSPKQRAVLLLRDVFDYSVLEVAEALRMSEANVKVVHHRARAAMATYDQSRCVPTRDVQARTRAALEAFLGALVTGDVAAAEALLASDVRALTDGGGKSRAALVPIVGPQRVVLFVRRLMEMRGMPIALESRMLNGLPAMVVVYPPAKDPMLAMHTVMRVDVDADGRIHALHSVVVDRKLTAVRMPVPE
jgi:RNA polymerase sigma-70 factor (ECF subfamily)